jgi:hypothetical protein
MGNLAIYLLLVGLFVLIVYGIGGASYAAATGGVKGTSTMTMGKLNRSRGSLAAMTPHAGPA